MSSISTIYFGAGCFWGVQYYFDLVDGVIETEVGYMGGTTSSPTYEDVCYKDTGHVEVTKVIYESSIVSEKILLNHFFKMHNPTEGNKQGPDIGEQYRSVIFYTNDEQRAVALDVSSNVSLEFKKPITTTVEPAPEFWLAEEYHQKYAERTGRGMCHVLPKDVNI